MPRSRAQIEFQKKQAIWYLTIGRSHQLFCNCGDWRDHLKKRLWPGNGEINTGSLPTPPIREEIIDAFIHAGGGDGFAEKSIAGLEEGEIE